MDSLKEERTQTESLIASIAEVNLGGEPGRYFKQVKSWLSLRSRASRK